MINKYNMNMIANKVYFKRSNMQRQLLLLDIAQIHQFYVWKDFLENLHPRERSVCERARDSGSPNMHSPLMTMMTKSDSDKQK